MSLGGKCILTVSGLSNNEMVLDIVSALMTVLVTIALLVGIKKFGNIKIGLVGPEFNLLTYGYLWDTCLLALRGENYWTLIPSYLIPFKSFLLLAIVLFNAVLMVINLKIANKIDTETESRSDIQKKRNYKMLSFFLGTLALFLFIIFKAFWK